MSPPEGAKVAPSLGAKPRVTPITEQEVALGYLTSVAPWPDRASDIAEEAMLVFRFRARTWHVGLGLSLRGELWDALWDVTIINDKLNISYPAPVLKGARIRKEVRLTCLNRAYFCSSVAIFYQSELQ